MVKPRLFSYRDSGIYYNKFGLSPDKHFDKLCERYGGDIAVKMIDENMMKAFESYWKEEKEKEEREQRELEMECPFE